jgi:hypothetical protein
MINCFIGYNDVQESWKISILNFCDSFEDGICTTVGLFEDGICATVGQFLHHMTLITKMINALFKLFFSIVEGFV